MEKYVNLKVADDTNMEAYIAIPEDATGQNQPRFNFIAGSFGVKPPYPRYGRQVCCTRFVVIAPEMYHRTAPPYFEGSYTNFEGVRSHGAAMTLEGNEADLKAAYHWLRPS